MFEAHCRYLDIHLMLEGQEKVEVASVERLEALERREAEDFYAYRGLGEHGLILTPGSFLAVFPGEAHRIKMQVNGPQTVTKVVFKVKLC